MKEFFYNIRPPMYHILFALVVVCLIFRLVLKIEYKVKYSKSLETDPFDISFKQRKELKKNALGKTKDFIERCNIYKIIYLVVSTLAVVYLWIDGIFRIFIK